MSTPPVTASAAPAIQVMSPASASVLDPSMSPFAALRQRVRSPLCAQAVSGSGLCPAPTAPITRPAPTASTPTPPTVIPRTSRVDLAFSSSFASSSFALPSAAELAFFFSSRALRSASAASEALMRASRFLMRASSCSCSALGSARQRRVFARLLLVAEALVRVPDALEDEGLAGEVVALLPGLHGVLVAAVRVGVGPLVEELLGLGGLRVFAGFLGLRDRGAGGGRGDESQRRAGDGREAQQRSKANRSEQAHPTRDLPGQSNGDRISGGLLVVTVGVVFAPAVDADDGLGVGFAPAPAAFVAGAPGAADVAGAALAAGGVGRRGARGGSVGGARALAVGVARRDGRIGAARARRRRRHVRPAPRITAPGGAGLPERPSAPSDTAITPPSPSIATAPTSRAIAASGVGGASLAGRGPVRCPLRRGSAHGSRAHPWEARAAHRGGAPADIGPLCTPGCPVAYAPVGTGAKGAAQRAGSGVGARAEHPWAPLAAGIAAPYWPLAAGIAAPYCPLAVGGPAPYWPLAAGGAAPYWPLAAGIAAPY